MEDQWPEDDTFEYTKNDGPNVDCQSLDKSDPGYPPHPRIVLLGIIINNLTMILAV